MESVAQQRYFKNTITNIICDIPGTKNTSDDILIFGKTKSLHDENLHKLFKRLRDVNGTVNKKKVVIDCTEINFYGMVFSGSGIKPNQNKVETIRSTTTPKSATETRSFLGLANFVSRFIKDYATISEPLWSLTNLNAKWEWTQKHRTALDSLKKA